VRSCFVKRLFIFHSCLSAKKIAAKLQEHGIKDYVTLVSDYEKVVEFKEVFKGIAVANDISAKLQTTAALLRRPYYKLSANFGLQYNSLEWWTNDISERNTMKSNLFLHCCYIYMVSEAMGEEGDTCVIADNMAVIRNINYLAEQRKIEIIKYCPVIIKDHFPLEIAIGLYKLVLHLSVYAITRLNRTYHKMLTRKFQPIKNPDVILHTWVDEKCFGNDGKFKDRYYTALPDHYRDKGVSWATFVSFSYRNIKRSLWSAYSFLHTNREHFIIPEDYYHIHDYIFPFKVWLKSRQFSFSGALLEGVDLSILLDEYNRKEPVHFESMYYLLFKRLARKGIQPAVVIDGFENMFTDKLIQLGVRHFMTGTAVYGFYHVVPPPNVLCFFTDINERDIVPMPDRIICNGNRYRDILIKEDFPEERIVVGSALRYHYLYSLKKSSGNTGGDLRVLAVLPVERDAAIELFQKSKEAIEGMPRYKMILKPHPMQTKVIDELKNSFLPGTQVFTGGMDEALSMCDVVVSAATGAVLDCVMADKEVIRVGRSTQIDFDPLAWFNEFGKPSYSTGELREKLLDAERRMKNPDYQTPRYSAMLPELFAPISEDFMKPFLPPQCAK
jgi:hypothetical protein